MLFDVPNPNRNFNWAYVNYLQVGNKIIVPTFGIPEDKQALKYHTQEVIHHNHHIHHREVMDLVQKPMDLEHMLNHQTIHLNQDMGKLQDMLKPQHIPHNQVMVKPLDMLNSQDMPNQDIKEFQILLMNMD